MNQTAPVMPQSMEHAIAWHSLPFQEALQHLKTTPLGLTEDEARTRQGIYGLNHLPARSPPTLLAIALHQLKSPLIYILFAAGLISIAIGDLKDAFFILIVVLINAGLGAAQEWKAERNAAALQQLLRITARVRRDGRESMIAADELVPGDIVLLESGNRVPAVGQ